MSDLKDANTNPWYVMMTLYGEQEEKHEMNKRAWNAWACQNLTEAERVELQEAGAEIPEAEAWDKIRADVHKLYSKQAELIENLDPSVLPDPNDVIRFALTLFPKPLVLKNFVFPKQIGFSGAVFEKPVILRSTFFVKNADFIGAKFRESADFTCIKFMERADFDGATFESNVDFSKAHFADWANFDQVKFVETSKFEHAKFEGLARFYDARFMKDTKYTNSIFEQKADFEKVVFKGSAFFSETVFHELTYFWEAEFDSCADFSFAIFDGFTSFWKAEFKADFASQKSKVTFEDSIFAKPTRFRQTLFAHVYPDFSGASLHEKTDFTAEDRFWPSGAKQDTKDAKSSCAVIRHVVARQGLIEEEQFFHRREMQFGGQIGNVWQRFPYRFYGCVSDYGNSIARPLVFLAIVLIIPAITYTYVFAPDIIAVEDSKHPLFGFGFSTANTFKLFGFQRTYFGEDIIDQLHWSLKLLSAAQTVAGFILLFFLGLGLRSRFRLR